MPQLLLFYLDLLFLISLY